jgi:uncharacterized protein with NRDE domain
MCILFIAVNQHPDYPLIVAANRDEFFDRPTRESSFWKEHPHILAGKDLRAGGTWMGINQQGKLSALTNIRDPQRIASDAASRGGLVSDYLLESPNSEAYLGQISASAERYNGFNLLFGDWNALYVFNNHTLESDKLTTGVYGLSNASLNTPWPKTLQGMAQLTEYCQAPHALENEHLFALLRNQAKAKDDILPQTGVPIEWERKLSSIFIQSPEYGTRSSTLLLVDNQQQVSWQERTFNNEAQCIADKSYHFAIK